MNPFSKTTELKLLLSVLQNRQPKLRSLILAETDPEYFGNKYAAEIRERIATLLRNGKVLGSNAEDWFDEPGLGQDARDFLKAAGKKLLRESKLYSKERVRKLLHNLKLRYRLRIALRGMEEAASLLEGKAGEAQLDEWSNKIQDTLERFKLGDERSEKLIIGQGQSNAAIDKLVKRYTKKRSGQYISFGMTALDFHYHGAQRGNVVTYSANSGGAKSAFALNCAINQVKAGFNVCYCSMEMDNDENMHRLIAKESQLEHGVVQMQEHGFTKRQKSKISRAIRSLHRTAKKKKSRLTLWDVQDSNFTPQQLEIEAKPYHYDVIYIDYITLFGSKRYTETWKMHLEYSRFLKGMAKRLNCMVVILAQLSDDEQLRYGKAIRDNTDFWFYWTYGEDEVVSEEAELKTGKARNYRRKQCMLDMSQIGSMIIHTVSDDLPDARIISERPNLPTEHKREKKEKLLGCKKKRRHDGASAEMGFEDEKRQKRRRRRRPKKDIDGA